MRKNRIGKIIKSGDVGPWPHEEATAKVLALYGHDVEFIRKSNREREHSANKASKIYIKIKKAH